MKSLVEDILAGREDRAKALEDIRKDVKHVRGEVKSFLKSSATSRQADFSATMKTIHGSLADVRKDSKHARDAGKTIVKDAQDLIANIAKDNKEQAKELHEKLKKFDHHRQTEFKSMMSNIGEDLKEVKKGVANLARDAREMVSGYHHSRMSARHQWASLSQNGKKAKKHQSVELNRVSVSS